MKGVAVLSFAVFCASTAQAGYYDGNQIYEGCQKSRMFVLGYVAGAYDAAETGQNALFLTYFEGLAGMPADRMPKFVKSYTDGSAALGSYCVPKDAILNQTTDIFCQYLASRPGERHEPANILLARALDVSWPCKAAPK